MALYSASLTANLTVSQINNSMKTVDDLRGKAVGSWEGHLETLKDEDRLSIVPYAWNNQRDEVKMLWALLNGEVQAQVLDESAL